MMASANPRRVIRRFVEVDDPTAKLRHGGALVHEVARASRPQPPSLEPWRSSRGELYGNTQKSPPFVKGVKGDLCPSYPFNKAIRQYQSSSIAYLILPAKPGFETTKTHTHSVFHSTGSLCCAQHKRQKTAARKLAENHSELKLTHNRILGRQKR